MFGLGFSEVIVIAVVALLAFGPQGLPDAARRAGRVVSRVRREVSTLRGQLVRDLDMQDELAQLREELQALKQHSQLPPLLAEHQTVDQTMQQVQDAAQQVKHELKSTTQALEEALDTVDDVTPSKPTLHH